MLWKCTYYTSVKEEKQEMENKGVRLSRKVEKLELQNRIRDFQDLSIRFSFSVKLCRRTEVASLHPTRNQVTGCIYNSQKTQHLADDSCNENIPSWKIKILPWEKYFGLKFIHSLQHRSGPCSNVKYARMWKNCQFPC